MNAVATPSPSRSVKVIFLSGTVLPAKVKLTSVISDPVPSPTYLIDAIVPTLISVLSRTALLRVGAAVSVTIFPPFRVNFVSKSLEVAVDSFP